MALSVAEPSTRNPGTVLVTGALGYIGNLLMQRLIADPAFTDSQFTAFDQRLPDDETAWADDPRVQVVTGDLGDSPTMDAALRRRPDTVFHLAGVLGGAAEADYELARRVNVDGSLKLLERLRNHGRNGHKSRVVYASSIAVYGPPLPAIVDDDTHPVPTLTYGGQKLMIESSIEQFSARHWIDGVALRLPGIVAREDADSRQYSAFLNTMFYAARDGRPSALPVSPTGRTWLVSARTVVDDLLHAALLPSNRLGRRRAITLPAQVVRIGDLVEALYSRFPHSRGIFTYQPNAMIESQFTSQPQLSTELADGLGFDCDATLDNLITRTLE